MVLKGVTGAAAILVVALVLRAAFTVPRQIPRNYNEGWNAYHAADLRAGRALYPAGSLFRNNYPPLSFVVVALVTPLAADELVAGRAVALVSFVAWIAMLAAAAHLMGASWLEGAFGAALCAGMMLVRTDYYVGVSEPQLLGHALQAAALLLVLRGSRPGVAWAGQLFAASLGVKHNLIVLPAAAIGWLLVTDRPAGRRLLGSMAVGVVLLVAASLAVWGTSMPEHLAASRTYLPSKAVAMSAQWLALWGVLLAVAGWLAAAQTRRGDPGGLVVLYAAGAVALGCAGFGGDGVYWNAMFDAQWALALAASLALRHARIVARQTALTLACAAPLAISVAGAADIHWLSPRFIVDPRWHEAATAAQEIAFVRSHAGPALCENLTLCFWAGKAPEVDFFDLQQQIRRDPSRADRLAARIESGEFGVVVLDGPRPVRDIGERVAAALARRYHVHHESQWGAFLVLSR